MSIDLRRLERRRAAASVDKSDLFDFYDRHWDDLIEEIRRLSPREAEVPFPPEIAARWTDILRAQSEILGWFYVYADGWGDDPEDRLPTEAPRTVTPGQVDERDDGTVHYLVGTFGMFRCTIVQLADLNRGYEDTAGTENERFIDDGDHVIVLYML